MRILTVLGTRPEIIRLSRIIPKLDELCDHVFVHTGQNFDASLNNVFFEELAVRRPDHCLEVRGDSFGEQVGKIMAATEAVLVKEKPDRVLILGDTNSGLTAIVAKRMGIPVYHMEAGNRCYDDRVPEEVNRRIIDHCSDVLMPYTEGSRRNLLHEGFPAHRIYVTGNPINEVIQHYDAQIRQSDVFERLDLESGKYFLVTMHRAENVDIESRLRSLAGSLDRLQEEYAVPVIVSTHPRTRLRMQSFGIGGDNQRVRFLAPLGFFDFITLERGAMCVLTDSGTVQEECAIFQIPNVTIRDVTERPETLECGSNMLSGADLDMITLCVRVQLARHGQASPPAGYVANNVSETVINILMGFWCGERE